MICYQFSGKHSRRREGLGFVEIFAENETRFLGHSLVEADELTAAAASCRESESLIRSSSSSELGNLASGLRCGLLVSVEKQCNRREFFHDLTNILPTKSQHCSHPSGERMQERGPRLTDKLTNKESDQKRCPERRASIVKPGS